MERTPVRLSALWLCAPPILAISCGRDAAAPVAPHDTTIVSIEFFPPLAPRQTAVAYVVHDDSTLWGVSYDPSELYQRATLWAPGQPPEDIGGPGDPTAGPSTYARGVNGAGIVAGYTNTSQQDWYPVRWTAAGAVDTLVGFSTFPYNGGFAYGVNEAGSIAGCSWVLTGNPQNLNAAVWSPDGSVQNLGTMGGQWSCAYAISGGFVVGEAAGQWSGGRAFRWTADSGMEDLGALGGPHSRAWGVNAQGEVVGEADQQASGVPGAFLWTPAAGLQRLPQLEAGISYGAGYAINDAGDAVGYSETPYGDHAMLWRASGEAVDLSYLSDRQSALRAHGHALAISPGGLIAGYEYNPATGRLEAALWRVTVVHTGAP